MSNTLKLLLAAIIKDDRVKAKALLDKEPALATLGVAEDERYEPTIVHWIYSGIRLCMSRQQVIGWRSHGCS
jgi:hypothetical protein